jgi:hypothetical protein
MSGWIPTGAGSLDDLTDVDLTGLATGDFIQFNGTVWVPVECDCGGSPGGVDDWGDLLTDPKVSADTPDDLFPGTSLDGQWTVTQGSAGTAVFLNADANRNIYQVDNGKLRFQVGAADTVEMRQDYTLPDGNSIIAAVEIPSPAVAGDNASIHFGLNDDDTSTFTGNDVTISMEQDTTEWIFQSDASGANVELVSGFLVSDLAYFRISRAGLVYRVFVSTNRGRSWTFLQALTAGAAMTNVWLRAVGPSALPTSGVNPIFTWYWVQQGSNDLDPW